MDKASGTGRAGSTPTRSAETGARTSPRAEPFTRYHRRYDHWFERHEEAYLAELLAVRALLPRGLRGLEIGVGSGRFAGQLGVEFGIDPAVEMFGYASCRGVHAAAAVAEALPFRDGPFDYAPVATTIRGPKRSERWPVTGPRKHHTSTVIENTAEVALRRAPNSVAIGLKNAPKL